MTNPSPRTRRSIVITSALAAAALCTLSAAPAMASGTAPQTFSAAAAQSSSVAGATAALAATRWETTGAVDQDGNAVALDDARAANFVGNAYFKTDGTFTMFNLDDSPKMQGAWEMREVDGQLVRWIAAKNAAGEVLFERVMPIVELDGSVFTYRVVSAADPAEWVDIVHTPTDHVEPGTVDVAAATAALAATPWETTGAVDQDGNAVALDDARAANFVGNAYFKTDGTFTMFNLDDSPKMQGAWEMREVDGQLVRWIAAKNAAGEVLFERVMPIVELDGSVFTYRVVSAADPAEWVDIVHTPTDHVEPGTDTENENEGENEGDNGGNGGSDGGGAGSDGSVVEDGTSADAGSETSAEANAQAGEAPNAEPAVQGKGSGSQELAATGGSGVMAGIAASGVALLGGAALLMSRALRRARG